jgi:hypothetical protein
MLKSALARDKQVVELTNSNVLTTIVFKLSGCVTLITTASTTPMKSIVQLTVLAITKSSVTTATVFLLSSGVMVMMIVEIIQTN